MRLTVTIHFVLDEDPRSTAPARFLLAVLPLTGIVFYSYRSSRTALEDAYHREARRLTTQMDRRLTSIRADLDQRLADLSAIPLGGMKSGTKGAGSPSREGMVDNIVMAMGEVAPLIDALEFVPVAPPAPPEAPHPGRVDVAIAPMPATDQNDFASDAGSETDPGLNESIVIDLPPREVPAIHDDARLQSARRGRSRTCRSNSPTSRSRRKHEQNYNLVAASTTLRCTYSSPRSGSDPIVNARAAFQSGKMKPKSTEGSSQKSANCFLRPRARGTHRIRPQEWIF